MEYDFAPEERKWAGNSIRRFAPSPRQSDGVKAGIVPQHKARSAADRNQSIAGGGTKKNFMAPASGTHKWKPGLKPVAAPVARESKGSGLKAVPSPRPYTLPEAERKHFEGWNQQSKGMAKSALSRSGRRIVTVNGVAAAATQAKEVEVNKMFGRKQRAAAASELARRNGVGVSNPGDKGYSNPEYAPGFYKGGGVIPGSNWGKPPPQGLFGATAAAAGNTMASTMASTGTGVAGMSMTYEQRRRIEIMLAEMDEVRQLNPGDDGDTAGTWEAATGQFTADSSDEEDLAEYGVPPMDDTT